VPYLRELARPNRQDVPPSATREGSMSDEDQERPARRALRVHVPTSDDPTTALCVFDGEYWPCPTTELAQELLERYP